MKNLLKLVLLVALFISTSSEVFSQTITNDTNCNFRGKIYFSYPSACDNSDDMNFFISATTSQNITVPAGARVTGAKGGPIYYSTSPINCKFGVTLCGGPDDDTINCGLPCGTVTVTIDTNGNIRIFN